MEGILEQKSEATDHCWLLSRFRLDAGLGTLDAFGADDDELEGPLQGRVWLRDVANLKLQGAKCTLEQVNGKKVRLRAETSEEANAWFQAITEAASVAAAEAEAKAAEAEAAAAESEFAGEVFDEDSAGVEPDPEEDGQFEDELVEFEEDLVEQHQPFPRQPVAASRPRSGSGGSNGGALRRSTAPSITADGGFVDARTRARLQELYESHGIKKKKLEEKKRLQDLEEAERLDAMRPKVRGITASAVSQRLYGEHLEAKNRKMEMQQFYEEKKQMELREEIRKARPTRSSSTGHIQANPMEACERLHGDAERRERERKEQREAAEIAELERLREQAIPKLCTANVGGSTGVSVHRHNDLYADAQARKERLELKREQAEEQERQRLASLSVLSGTATANPNRFLELHQEYAERQRRRQAAAAERQMKEAEDIKRDLARTARRTGSAAGNGGRPSGPTLKGLASLSAGGSVTARRASSPRPSRKEEPAAGQAMSARQPRARSPSAPPNPQSPGASTAASNAVAPTPSTQADCALEAVGRALVVRGVFEGKSTLSQDLKSLAAPLRAATAIFRDAHTSLLAAEGYATLCAFPSQRLYGEHLMPEPEGWARGFEPDPVRQVEEDLGDLLASACLAHCSLKERIAHGGVLWEHGLLDTRPEGVPAASMAYDPGPKTESAARAKAVARYGCAEGREKAWRHLTDLARLCLIFESCELLLTGVQQILHQFETVGLRNYFATSGPIGVRYIEMLVVVPVGPEGMPHVCEVRLEHAAFFGAHQKASPHLERFFQAVDQASRAARKDELAVAAVVRAALAKPPPNHALRIFRCQLTKRFGSAACCWRRSVLAGSGSGAGRIARFDKFKEVCQALKCIEQTVQLWEGLDCSLAGCVSLFELDPEALVLLLRARHVLSANDERGSGGMPPLDAEATFARLSKLAKPVKAGYLQEHEFRGGALRLGLSREEADRVFDYLDYCGGSHHAPPATITVADVAWLLRLPQLVDASSVSLMAPSSESGGEEDDFGDFMDNRSRRSAWSASTSSSGRASSATPVTSRCPRRVQVLGRGLRGESGLKRSGSDSALNSAPPSLRLEPGHMSEVSDSDKEGRHSPRRLSDASTTASAVQMAMASIPPAGSSLSAVGAADREQEGEEEDMNLLLHDGRGCDSEREPTLSPAFLIEESY